jgi:competence protein ComEC
MNCLIPKSHYKINDTVIDGYIHSYKIDGNKLSIMLYGKEKVIINYYFKSLEEKEAFNLRLGDYLNIKGVMNKPKSATVFNLFDYKKYLNHNHIFFLMTANKIDLIKHNTRLRYTIKQFISDHIEALPKSASYVKALVIGDDDGFRDEVNKSYQLNGISHLFAISGSHISFLAVIILFVLKRLRVEENKRYYAVILFLLFYMFLTDYAGSVVRAVAFFAILSINKMYYFNIKTINILQLTLFIILLFKPSLLYDVGFQFSFLISLYLILNQSFINKAGNYFKQTFVISFIAFLVSIPICINNFFQINLLSTFINLFFVPFISFIIFPLSFLCLVFPFLDKVLFFFIKFLEWFSISLSHIEIGNLILAKPSFVVTIIYYVVITIAIKGMTMKKYHYFSLLGIILFVHCNINWFNNNPYIVFLDVGQGDSIFINLPHNKGNILIDTGGKLDFTEAWAKRNKEYIIGEDLIIPYLKSIGVKQLNYLILTHGDEDHMGESINIIKSFKVKKVLLNSGSLVKLEDDFIKVLKKMHIPYNFGKANDVITIDKYNCMF